MNNVLKGIEPKNVMKYFEKLTEIPRGSGNEKEVSDYLVDFAKKRNLEVIQDKALNVIIKKPATKGYEKGKSVILQGHMDIVCIKEENLDGTYIADLGSSNYVDTFEKRVDPMGEDYYWLSGRTTEEFSYNTDIWAVNHNKVALTPLKIDLTNVSQKEVIQKILKS